MSNLDLILANFPSEWFTDNPKIASVLTTPDTMFTDLEAVLTNVKTTFNILTATGTDLDALGALLGLPRSFNETDDAYRARILGTVLAAQNLASISEIAYNLSIALGQNALVYDDPTPGNFTVILLNASSIPPVRVIKALLETLRAAGTSYRVLVNTSSRRVKPPLINGFVLGTKPLGLNNYARII